VLELEVDGIIGVMISINPFGKTFAAGVCSVGKRSRFNSVRNQKVLREKFSPYLYPLDLLRIHICHVLI